MRDVSTKQIPKEFKRAIADELRSWPYMRVTVHRTHAVLALFQDMTRTCEDGLSILLGHAKPVWSRVCILKLRANPRLRCQLVFTDVSQKECPDCEGTGQCTCPEEIERRGDGDDSCWECEGTGYQEIDTVDDTVEIDLDAPDSMDRLFATIKGNYRLLKWREATGITE